MNYHKDLDFQHEGNGLPEGLTLSVSIKSEYFNQPQIFTTNLMLLHAYFSLQNNWFKKKKETQKRELNVVMETDLKCK